MNMIKLSMSVGLHLINQETNYRTLLRLGLKHILTVARFPCVLPFSQMYPLCCIDIRNFLNQFYFFSDDHFQHPNVIDETLRRVRLYKIPEYAGADFNLVVGPAPFRKGLQV